MVDKQIKDPCDKCDVETTSDEFKCPTGEHNRNKNHCFTYGLNVY